MLYDITHFWAALLIAFAIGILVPAGPQTSGRTPIPRATWSWVTLCAIVFVVGIVVAVLKILPGRPGLWLETALLIFGAYSIGWAISGSLFGEVANEYHLDGDPQITSRRTSHTSASVSRWTRHTTAFLAISAVLLMSVECARQRKKTVNRR